MLYIGIDPGMDGGLAAIGDTFVKAIPMPTITGTEKGTKRALDVFGILKWYEQMVMEDAQKQLLTPMEMALQVKLVVIEKVHSIQGQGIASSFSFGMTFGLLIGITQTLRMSMQLVPPQRWKKLILDGTLKDKAAAIQYVRQKYPTMSLRATERCTTDHDGMAEAVCMAEYARRISA